MMILLNFNQNVPVPYPLARHDVVLQTLAADHMHRIKGTRHQKYPH